jgi:hypothetical protein
MPFTVSYLDGGDGVSIETFSIGEAIRRARQFRSQGRLNIDILEEESGRRFTIEQAEAEFRGRIEDV